MVHQWLPALRYPSEQKGYWEPVTSTINWCEEVEALHSFLTWMSDTSGRITMQLFIPLRLSMPLPICFSWPWASEVLETAWNMATILSSLSHFSDISWSALEASYSTARSNVRHSSSCIMWNGLCIHGSLLIRGSRSHAACRWAFDDIYNLPDVLRLFLLRNLSWLLTVVGN